MFFGPKFLLRWPWMSRDMSFPLFCFRLFPKKRNLEQRQGGGGGAHGDPASRIQGTWRYVHQRPGVANKPPRPPKALQMAFTLPPINVEVENHPK